MTSRVLMLPFNFHGLQMSVSRALVNTVDTMPVSKAVALKATLLAAKKASHSVWLKICRSPLRRRSCEATGCPAAVERQMYAAFHNVMDAVVVKSGRASRGGWADEVRERILLKCDFFWRIVTWRLQGAINRDIDAMYEMNELANRFLTGEKDLANAATSTRAASVEMATDAGSIDRAAMSSGAAIIFVPSTTPY
eukprot:CAMPEP_0182818484 /NCGR_PEP_ID=MMETSP0006_2-20121128/12043_1 /TAXON_ID=97485 /ORGANISM="Prymnesium parvum, Strain Texoma1" /LENGTH=194 /DNA_ID=CAMNT_0024944941 /DNA_START=252 /DNA_END=839 /DNA_ORIENTATION=+